MNLGRELSNIRKKLNMTQEEFGKLFHVTRQTVSNWENEKSYPDLQTLVDISAMFDISLDRLLKGEQHMKEFLLKKEDRPWRITNNREETFYILKEEKSLPRKETYTIITKAGHGIGQMICRNLLFSPAKLPIIEAVLNNGESFILRKEIEQLEDAIVIESEKLSVKGSPLLAQFELLYEGKSIALFRFDEDNRKVICEDMEQEGLVIAFAFSMAFVR